MGPLVAKGLAKSTSQVGSVGAIIVEKQLDADGEVVLNEDGTPAILRRYTQAAFLGKGAYARVYQVQEVRTKEVLAAKVIPKENLQRESS